MKNIAIVYERELQIGGVETHILSLLKHINRAQFSYIVVSPVAEDFRQLASSLGAMVCQIPYYQPLDLRMAKQLAGIFHEYKIDLVHMHSPIAAVPGRLAARWVGLPALVTVHIPAIYYYGKQHTLHASTGRFIYSSIDRILNYVITDQIVYVSNKFRNIYVTQHLSPAKRSIVIPNGIALELFQPDSRRELIRRQFNLPANMSVITYVGRLSDQKGLDVLLEALVTLKSQFNFPFIVWLIGPGPLETELRQMVTRLNLEENVHFLGRRQPIADYLLASDCFVLPSRWEAMSIALLEAMAAGLPSVVTDVGDNAWLIEDGQQGFVVPPNSSEQLSSALYKLLRDKTLQQKMGASALIKAQNYNETGMVERVQSLYEKILKI